MRHVSKNLANVPAIFKKASTTDDWELIAKGATDKISDDVYKGTYKDSEGKSQSQVRDELNVYYYSKCAYCEVSCKAEIEHYRPKKGVTGAVDHKGYYWLCYEWSNLVPSCRYCNTEGGKGNQFPIAATGTRISSPPLSGGKLDKTKCFATCGDLVNEHALLLHPEIDLPEQHLEYCWRENMQGIYVKEAGGSLRGKETIKICNLNREYLRVDRLKVVLYPLKQQLDLIFLLVRNNKISGQNLGAVLTFYFDQLVVMSQDKELPYTLLRKFIVSSEAAFNEIVGKYITDEGQSALIMEAFKGYREGTLS
ncbi:MAG: hypothetical protein V4649_01765 [Bacteroidota bacterium]